MIIKIHKVDLEKRKELFKTKFSKEHKHIIEFLKLLSLGEINKGVAVEETRQRKLCVERIVDSPTLSLWPAAISVE